MFVGRPDATIHTHTHTYTRKQAKRDTADPRAASFLRLCALLQAMQRPPSYIALENVEVNPFCVVMWRFDYGFGWVWLHTYM